MDSPRLRAVRALLVAIALVCAGGAVWAAPAGAAVPASFRDCGNGFKCGRVSVPLDRSGTVPGTISLAVKVHEPLGTGAAQGAVVALAGGPGQGATPYAADFLTVMRSSLRSRELVVFDQRGTGHSNALVCAGLSVSRTPLERRQAAASCAQKLGPAKDFYSTRDSADDIDAVRQALGIGKVTVAGTSYGTKVALAYAKRYPDHVERLVLDSVVPLQEHPFMLPTFNRIPFLLRDNCGLGGCKGITGTPVGDVAKLAQRLRAHALTGPVITPNGRRVKSRLTEEDLLNIVIGGDLDPTILADLPGSVKGALAGDPTPILRLLQRGNATEGPMPPQIFSDGLQFATVCEEAPLPWSRTEAIDQRPATMEAAIAAIPPAQWFPFGPPAARSAVEDCLLWPQAPQAPDIGGGALPDVPVLIYSGMDDVRTPLFQAEEVAAMFPRASLVQVPYTGHSVLTSDGSGCADRALHDFFGDRPVKPCRGGSPFLFPTEIPPVSQKQARRTKGVPGEAGRTVTAVRATLADAVIATIAASFTTSGPFDAVHVGGLRAGHAVGPPFGVMVLHGMSYVPGVTVSGRLKLLEGDGHLEVSGPAAAAGRVTLRHGDLSGVLGGVRFKKIPISSDVVGSSARHRALPLLAAARKLLRRPAPTG
jgi:pimeloyl-ACP methyl ester carboxylesterase